MEQRAKLFAGIIFVVVTILMILYFVSPNSNTSSIMPKAAPAMCIDEWREFRSPAGHFTISLPTPPQEATASVPTPSSEELIQYDMLLSQSKRGTICMVNIIDYPQSVDVSNAETVLKTAIQEIVAGNQSNQLKRQESITFQGCPAIEFVILNEQAAVHGMAMLKNRSLYVISATDQELEDTEDAFQKMSESFRIIE